MRCLRSLGKGHGSGFGHTLCGGTHGERRLGTVVELRRVQTTGLLDGTKVSTLIRSTRHGGNLLSLTRIQQFFALFAQKDRVSFGREHDISKDVIQIQNGSASGLDASRRALRGAKERWWTIGMRRHGKMAPRKIDSEIGLCRLAVLFFLSTCKDTVISISDTASIMTMSVSTL
jgi:hypothetical protein